MESAIRRNEEREEMDKYFYETERLASFEGCQLKVLTAEDLSEGGFYWDNENLFVCAFCCGRLLISNVDVEGISFREKHGIIFPHCPYVSEDVTPNVPLRECKILARLLSDDHKSRLIENEDEYLIIDDDYWRHQFCRDPNYLQMKRFGLDEYWDPKRKSLFNYEARIQTFDKWPKTNFQDPSKLAKAGFYYFGEHDDIRCFYCNIGLRNWGSKDKPYIEHARWSPDCIFLLLRKGIKFVRKALRKNPPYLPESSKLSSLLDWTKSNRSTTFTKEEFEFLLELPIMKELLRINWSEETVREAFMYRLGRTGHTFPSLKAGIQELTQLAEDKMLYPPSKMDIGGEHGNHNDSFVSSYEEDIPFPNLNVNYEETKYGLPSAIQHGHRIPPPKDPMEYFFPHKKLNNFSFGQVPDEDQPNYPVTSFSESIPTDCYAPPDNPFTQFCSPVESTASNWFSMTSLTVASNYKTDKTVMYYNEDKKTWEEERETYMKCKNCYKRTSDTVLLPCMHMVACYKCAIRLQICPSCEEDVNSISQTNTY